jgi:paraquat-inducible protein A
LAEPAPTGGLLACPGCDLLLRRSSLPGGGMALCPRCHSPLYRRRPSGIETALALNLAAMLLLLLSNLFPLFELRMGGQQREATLWDSVLTFFDEGAWLLGTLVLGTSLVMPLVRLLGLLYVLGALRFRLALPRLGRIFRGVRSLSPWGMLEIYLLGALVAAVKLGDQATIVPGVAAFAFACLILVLAWSAAVLEPQGVWDRIPPVRPGAAAPLGGRQD